MEGDDGTGCGLRLDGSGFGDLGRTALVDRVRLKVRSRNAASSKHGMGLAFYTGRHDAFGTNPDAVLQCDGTCHEVE